MRRFLFVWAVLLGFVNLAAGGPEGPAPQPRKGTFLCLLRLTEAYHADAAWTPEANAAVGAHFRRLQAAAREGRVILAGRTSESNEQTLGLVIFEAVDLEEARAFMGADPAVIEGIMRMEVRPYRIAVAREPAQPAQP